MPQLLLVTFVLRPPKVVFGPEVLRPEAGPAGVRQDLKLGGTEASWTYRCQWDQRGWI